MQKNSIERFQTALKAREAVKIIAGIANFDKNQVLEIVRAAEASGAHAVDVAASLEIVKAVCETSTIAVFASSVKPQELADAVTAGAHVAELGNFDALYDQGFFLSADEVLKLAQETMTLVQGKALVSITVPGHLTPQSQTSLAKQLEALGVDMLQTEGSARVLSSKPTVKSLTAAEKESLTLRNTKLLVAKTRLPVITASGINAENVNLAFEAGASAVGVGTYIKQAQSEADMTDRVARIMANRASQLLHAAV